MEVIWLRFSHQHQVLMPPCNKCISWLEHWPSLHPRCQAPKCFHLPPPLPRPIWEIRPPWLRVFLQFSYLNNPPMAFCLKKNHIWTFDHFLRLHTNTSLCFGYSREINTWCPLRPTSFVFDPAPLYKPHNQTWLRHVWHPPVPHLVRCSSFNGLGWTLVAHVHRIAHRLHPEFMAQTLGMNHGRCHLYNGLVCSLCHAIPSTIS